MATTARDPSDDVTRAAKLAAGLGIVFTAGAFGIYGGRAAASVALGAAIAVANLVTMRMIIRALMTAPEDETADPNADHKAEGKRGGAAWGVFAVFKILILFGGIWLLLSKGLVDPMPLVVGYGVLPLGIAGSSLFANLGPRRK
jgi:hypothetical protein